MSTTTYITQPNDRWDLVAYKAYGDAARFPDLVKANPGVAAEPLLPSGIELRIPVLDVAPIAQSTTNLLPPWKR